jgi:hypothetical protein
MRAVPPHFFDDDADFEARWPELFSQYCAEVAAAESQAASSTGEEASSSTSQLAASAAGRAALAARLEELGRALDAAEGNLLREVAARSGAMFSAAHTLQTLRASLAEAVGDVRKLRARMAALDARSYKSASAVVSLRRRRAALASALSVTRALDDVASCRSALEALLAAQDYPGSLELCHQLRGLLAADELSGVQCVRPLLPQLAETQARVEASLQQAFLGAAALGAESLAQVVERVSRIVLEDAVSAAAEAADRGGGGGDGGEGDGNGNNNEAAIEAAAAEALRWRPIPLALVFGVEMEGEEGEQEQQQEHDGGRGSSEPGGSSSDPTAAARARLAHLSERLLPLALGLHRAGLLPQALGRWQEGAADETKRAVRELVSRLLPRLLANGPHGAAAVEDGILGGGGGGRPGTGGGLGGGGVSAAGGAAPLSASASASAGGAATAPPPAPSPSPPPPIEPQLAEQLGALDHAGFMALLRGVAAVVSACLVHTRAVGGLIVDDVLLGQGGGGDTAASSSSSLSPQELASARRDVAWAAQQVADVGQGRWVKLLAARAPATARLRLFELRALLDAAERFSVECERAAASSSGGGGAGGGHGHGGHGRGGGGPSAALRSALQAQARAFVDAFHARTSTRLLHVLEAEQWVLVEVPPRFQAIADRLSSFASSSSASRPPSGGGGLGAGGAGGAAAAAAPSDPSSSSNPQHPELTLHLRGRRYHLVNAALLLLSAAGDYASVAAAIPAFSAEVAAKLLEALRLFNATTAQLVLGAGAMRTAGLRSISAKQLALSGQALSMAGALLPDLRAALLAAASAPRRALLAPEFDRVQGDLQLHVDQVLQKLVDIMRDRLAVTERQLLEAPPPAPADAASSPAAKREPHASVASLARNLSTLRAILAPLLFPEQAEAVFGAVVRACGDGLAAVFEVLVSGGGASGGGGGGGGAAAAITPPLPLAASSGGGALPTVGSASGAPPRPRHQDEHLLLLRGQAWEPVCRASALCALRAFAAMPLDRARLAAHGSRLTTWYVKHFGPVPDLDDDDEEEEVAVVAPAAAVSEAAAAAPAEEEDGAAAAVAVAEEAPPAVAQAPPSPAEELTPDLEQRQEAQADAEQQPLEQPAPPSEPDPLPPAPAAEQAAPVAAAAPPPPSMQDLFAGLDAPEPAAAEADNTLPPPPPPPLPIDGAGAAAAALFAADDAVSAAAAAGAAAAVATSTGAPPAPSPLDALFAAEMAAAQDPLRVSDDGAVVELEAQLPPPPPPPPVAAEPAPPPPPPPPPEKEDGAPEGFEMGVWRPSDAGLLGEDDDGSAEGAAAAAAAAVAEAEAEAAEAEGAPIPPPPLIPAEPVQPPRDPFMDPLGEMLSTAGVLEVASSVAAPLSPTAAAATTAATPPPLPPPPEDPLL